MINKEEACDELLNPEKTLERLSNPEPQKEVLLKKKHTQVVKIAVVHIALHGFLHIHGGGAQPG